MLVGMTNRPIVLGQVAGQSCDSQSRPGGQIEQIGPRSNFGEGILQVGRLKAWGDGVIEQGCAFLSLDSSYTSHFLLLVLLYFCKTWLLIFVHETVGNFDFEEIVPCRHQSEQSVQNNTGMG